MISDNACSCVVSSAKVGTSHGYFSVISYYFIQSILLKLVVYVLKLTLFIFTYSLDSTTILGHLSFNKKTTPR